MKMLMAAALLASAGCALAVFHSGRTSLARRSRVSIRENLAGRER
jgi:hypothetical protein